MALFTVLLAPRDCLAELKRPQGPSLQATLLPDEAGWLQGERLHASLADGRRVAITGFEGDVVHAHALGDAHEPGAALRLHPAELVGMQWTESRCEDDTCSRLTFRVASAAPDETENTMPEHRSNRDTWLYRVEGTALPAPGAPDADDAHDAPEMQGWQDACADEPGDGMGLFVAGRWDSDGTWHAGGYTFSCARGAIAKCARSWGYKPWKTLSTDHGHVSLHPLHLACTRAARADYCGDGTPHTREGVLIGMSDGHGFNPGAGRDRDREAVFDPQGALRVHDWRIPDLAPACRPARTPSASAPDLIDVIDVIEVWR